MTSVMPTKKRKTKQKPVDMTGLKFRLDKAKIKLILDHPFFGVIAMKLPVVWTEKVPTAAVDGRQMYFNPYFVDGLTDDELVFLVAHECMHLMMEHCLRRGARDPRRWNVAADYVGNHHLVTDRIGQMPEGGLHSPDLTDNGKRTTEQVYDLLPDDGGQGEGGDQGDGQGGDPLDEIIDSTDPSLADETKVLVAQAAQAAQAAGNMSAGLKRLVDTLLNPKVRWSEVLRDFMVRSRTTKRTYARPNRRAMFNNSPVLIPSITGSVMGEVVVFVDCSGSIDDALLKVFGAELRGIQADTSPEKLHVIYFDSQVLHHDEFEDDEVTVNPHGGGGTAFSPLFAYLNDKGIDPVCAVVLTDLCCSDFGPAPAYPVLWVSTEKTTAPWGQVIKIN